MEQKKKYAVVTGASSGIGTEFAVELSKKGYLPVLVARREERLRELADRLKADFGTEARLIALDISTEEGCSLLMKEVEDLPIEIWINNAGFGDCGRFVETDLQKELDMIDLNIKSLHILTKKALQKMKKDDHGYILNIASSAGILPAGPYMATYYATKAYVVSFTQAIARELKEEGSAVYIGCVCPGPVDTEFNSVANVEFALRGITPQYCATYSLKKMFQKKIVIIPSHLLQVGLFFGRFLPRTWYVAIAARQQKKKLSKERVHS